MREIQIDISEEDAEVFDAIASSSKVSRELLDLIGFDAAEALKFVEETGHVPSVSQVDAIIRATKGLRPSMELRRLRGMAKQRDIPSSVVLSGEPNKKMYARVAAAAVAGAAAAWGVQAWRNIRVIRANRLAARKERADSDAEAL